MRPRDGSTRQILDTPPDPGALSAKPLFVHHSYSFRMVGVNHMAIELSWIRVSIGSEVFESCRSDASIEVRGQLVGDPSPPKNIRSVRDASRGFQNLVVRS